MLDLLGRVCEYDNYTLPPQGEDTPENRVLREKALNEFLKKMEEDKRQYLEQTKE